MRRLLVTAALCGTAMPAWSEAWRALTGPEIAAALTDRSLAYENGARQSFREGGGTTYRVGAGVSEGRWRVEEDRYCSNWPPAESWSCYVLEREAETGRLRFSGASGDMSIGSYEE